MHGLLMGTLNPERRNDWLSSLKQHTKHWDIGETDLRTSWKWSCAWICESLQTIIGFIVMKCCNMHNSWSHNKARSNKGILIRRLNYREEEVLSRVWRQGCTVMTENCKQCSYDVLQRSHIKIYLDRLGIHLLQVYHIRCPSPSLT